VVHPVVHQNLVQFFCVFLELDSNLLGPDNGTAFSGNVSDFADLAVFCLSIRLFELFIKQGNTVLDGLQELTLILLNGGFYSRSEEQSIEFREDPEHFIGIGGASEFFPQFFGDQGFSNIDFRVELFFCLVQFILPFLAGI